MVTADAVVVATNTPINDRVAIHTKQAPYLTYVIGARVPARLGAAGARTGTPPTRTTTSACIRDGDDDLLIVGGEDHKTGQADDTGRAPRAAREPGRASASR